MICLASLHDITSTPYRSRIILRLSLGFDIILPLLFKKRNWVILYTGCVPPNVAMLADSFGFVVSCCEKIVSGSVFSFLSKIVGHLEYFQWHILEHAGSVSYCNCGKYIKKAIHNEELWIWQVDPPPLGPLYEGCSYRTNFLQVFVYVNVCQFRVLYVSVCLL